MTLDAQITFRLPRRLAGKLDEAAAARGTGRSDVVRAALRMYLEGTTGGEPPFERIGELAGAARGGPPDLGARHRHHLTEMLGGG